MDLNPKYFKAHRDEDDINADISRAVNESIKAKPPEKSNKTQRIEYLNSILKTEKLRLELSEAKFESHSLEMMFQSRRGNEYLNQVKKRIELHQIRLDKKQSVIKAEHDIEHENNSV